MQQTLTQKPSHIFNVAAFPKNRSARRYPTNTGTAIIVAKRDRQVLDALIIGPVFCASPLRLFDSMHCLQRDQKIEVEIEFLANIPSDWAKRCYSYYFRADCVGPVSEAA